MGRREDQRAEYERIRAELEEWVGDDVLNEVEGWTSGEIAATYFGTDANELDALFFVSVWEQQMKYVVYSHVEAARLEDRSWEEIAGALGISRQAAVKRFGPGTTLDGRHATRRSALRRKAG